MSFWLALLFIFYVLTLAFIFALIFCVRVFVYVCYVF